jgi:hypothetical protein
MSLKKRLFHIAQLLLAATLASSAYGMEGNARPQVIIQWDNDLLTGTDDGYTNGARIAYVRELSPDGENFNRLQDFLKTLTGAAGERAFGQWQFPESEIERIQYGVGLTQLMFTPDEPATLTPPRGDRPYAGWLGLEFSLQANAGHSASTATLSVGTTGRHSFAEDNQEWVHRNVSESPIFQGWDSQAPSELTVNLHFDHKQRLRFLDDTRDWPIQMDGFYAWGAALGNFRTDAYLGTLIRAGYNLPANHTTPRVQLGSFTDTLFANGASGEKHLSLYGFMGARGYAVLHDITLDGPVFRDWGESVDSEPWVGELSFGVAARWQSVEVSLSHTLRSQEFDHQRNRSRFGSVMLRAEIAY